MGLTFLFLYFSQKSSTDSSVTPSIGMTNTSPMIPKATKPGDDPNGSSWLPSFTIGGSSTRIFNNTLTWMLISFIVFCNLHL
ncbi:hypothetical protein Hanom_Chr15g01409331 [Helianthus anomalus]